MGTVHTSAHAEYFPIIIMLMSNVDDDFIRMYKIEFLLPHCYCVPSGGAARQHAACTFAITHIQYK